MKVFPYLSRPFVFLVLLALSLSGCGVGTRFIFSSTDDLVATPDRRGLPFEEAVFRTADGVRLHGWFVPASTDLPLILFFHGNAANISHRVENLHHLHSMGFPVFIFDYRGFGRSEGWPSSEADLVRDARGALAWLAGRGWTPQRMIYFGSSMGAAVALQTALESPPAGVVLEAPFTTLQEIARRVSPITYALVGWWSIGDRFDNLDRVGRLAVPILIFHGDRDSVVPAEMSRRLIARAREPKTLVIVPGAGHSNAYVVGGEEYRSAWLRFAGSLRAGNSERGTSLTTPTSTLER